MQLYQINEDPAKIMRTIDVDNAGITIMRDKAALYTFLIKGLSLGALNILKQDALSIGAELATPKEAILCKQKSYDCLLIASMKQIKILSKKELAQPFELKEVAKALKRYTHARTFNLQIMGVINTNEDSFYAQSRFSQDSAVDTIAKMIIDGADIIDVGAVSSRPNAPSVRADEELKRISKLADTIHAHKLYQKATFSVDSYEPKVISYLLERGFTIVNDITGLENDDVAKLVSAHRAKVVIMHKQGTPQTMQHNPSYQDVVVEVREFFQERIEKALKFGIAQENIILDVGIGFGKSLEHNIALIKSLGDFKQFGCELLIGASRKSMIDALSPSDVTQRLGGTLALHLQAYQNGANIIRVHDVYEHKQAFDVLKACQ